ncbi:MAG: hypothetical protein IJT72_07715 [Lachnospiraceae bacterium]|nr:hypothetical protein [Lachnospiraceae bacterium]
MPDKPDKDPTERKPNRRKIFITAIISLTSVLIIAVLCIALFYFLYKRGFFLPKYITWNNQSDTFTIDNKTVDFKLSKRKLSIIDHDTGELLYKAPKEWLVSDYFFADIDSDERNEVVLIVWKRGSFGEHKPFWHKGKDNKWTQHIFIYEWDSERKDRLDPKWMSSGLGIKVHKFEVDEKNRVHFIDDEGEETVWQWLGWGLTLVDVIPVSE